MIQVKPLKEEDIIKNIVKSISSRLPDARVILFGSRVKNTNRESSDFDIVIIDKNKINIKIYYDIQEELGNLATLKTIDLIDYYNLDDDFKKIVIEEGRVIYDGNS